MPERIANEGWAYLACPTERHPRAGEPRNPGSTLSILGSSRYDLPFVERGPVGAGRTGRRARRAGWILSGRPRRHHHAARRRAPRPGGFGERRSLAMDGSTPAGANLARFRDYLRILAELEMGRGLAPRLDPSDIVQETLLRAHRAAEQIAGASDDSCRAWLRTILGNTLATAWRDEHRAKRDLRREVPLDRSLDRSSARIVRMAADLSSPSDRLHGEERLLGLCHALASLPDDQRQAFLARHWEGLAVDDIAQRMGRTRPAIAGLLRRATVALRAELGNREAD